MRVTLDPEKVDWVPAEVEKSMHAAIGALKFQKGKSLAFHFPYVYRKESNHQEGQNRIQTLSRRWAEENELTYFSVTYFPRLEP